MGPGEPDLGKVRFDELEVGQRSRYKLFEVTNVAMPESYDYTDVILVLTVTEETSDGFVLVESFEEGHELPEDWIWGDSDVEQEYLLRVSPGKENLEIKGKGGSIGSWIFSRYARGEDWGQLPLDPPDGPATQITGWQTDLGFCECRRTGLVSSFDLFDVTYQNLSVVMDDSATGSDGPGFTHVYSRDDGVVRSTMYHFYTSFVPPDGIGWDLLP